MHTNTTYAHSNIHTYAHTGQVDEHTYIQYEFHTIIMRIVKLIPLMNKPTKHRRRLIGTLISIR